MIKLKPHQTISLEWLENKPKAVLGLDAGLGKTLLGIKTLVPGERVLIIVPASLKLYWYQEIKKYLSFKTDIKIVKNRKDSLGVNGISIINYDIIGEKIGKKAVPSFNFSKFDYVILDESHAIKNTTSIRTKIAAKIIKNTNRATLLTGTFAERPIDMYPSLYAIGAISMSKHDYGMRYCDGKKIYLGKREVWDYRGRSNEAELKELIKDYVLIMKKDKIDLPEKIFQVIELDLPLDKRNKDYNLDDIKKDPRHIGFLGLAETIHDEAFRLLPLAIQHIKMRLESTDKIIIFTRHQDVLDIVMEKLSAYNPVKHDGRCSSDQKDIAVDKFTNDKNCRLFIGNIKSAGLGLNLQVASDIIFVEYSWSYSDISQCCDRVHRIGQKNTCYIEFLTIANSINTRMLYTTLEKQQFVNEVLK